MSADYIALSIVAFVGISIGLWGLHEAKKYRARVDAEKLHGTTGQSQVAH